MSLRVNNTNGGIMKKLNCALLVTFMSFQALARTQPPSDVKFAQAMTKKLAKMQRGKTLKKLEQLQILTKSYQGELKKTGGRKLEALQLKMIKIAKDKNLSHKQKTKSLSKLIKKNQNDILNAWKKVPFKSRQYELKLKKLFPKKKIQIKEVASVSMHSPIFPEEPARRDLSLQRPFTYPFVFEEQAGIGSIFTVAESNHPDGRVKSGASTMWLPYAHAMAGVSERLEIPEGIHRVKITSHLYPYDSTAFSVGMFGFAYSTSNIFLNVSGNNRILCKESFEMNSSMSPVFWAHMAASSQIQSLTCELRVSSLDHIIITTGGESFAMAALNSGSNANNESLVESIDVEFID